MHTHPFPSSSNPHPLRHAALASAATRLHNLAMGAAYLARFIVLSALAVLLLSSPISVREVPYDHHRPSPGR
jgi:hypothetical protein